MSIRRMYYVVRKPGWDSLLFVHLPPESVESALRRLYADNKGAQIDLLSLSPDGLGGDDIVDGRSYLDGFDAMKDAPPYDPDDDSDD